MTLWKINCMEDRFPGMWQRWYGISALQSDGVPPGFSFRGPHAKERLWLEPDTQGPTKN